MSLKLKKKPLREVVMANEEPLASNFKDRQLLDENGQQSQRCYIISHLSTLFPDFDAMVGRFSPRLSR